MKRLACIVALLFSTVAVAQESTPALTEVQSLQLSLVIKEAENAQLRLEKALRDRDDAVRSAQEVIRSLQKPGYTFDVQKREYAPVVTGKPQQ